MAAVVDILALSEQDSATFMRTVRLLERAYTPATDATAQQPKRALINPIGPGVQGVGTPLVGANRRRRSLTVFAPATATNLYWGYERDFGQVDQNGVPAVGMPFIGGVYEEWDGWEYTGSLFVLNTAAIGAPPVDVRYSDLSYDPAFVIP
ncbi:MAG TPA: hypothetical protein VMU89_14755 [Thermomicrobiaceae bacterium]|nr:hypothetical protein [Thermomicrobiaceae bacterium]